MEPRISCPPCGRCPRTTGKPEVNYFLNTLFSCFFSFRVSTLSKASHRRGVACSESAGLGAAGAAFSVFQAHASGGVPRWNPVSQTKFRYRDALFSTTSAKYHRPSEHGDCGGRGRTLGWGGGGPCGGGGGGPEGGRAGGPPPPPSLIPHATTLKEGGGGGGAPAPYPSKMLHGEVRGGGGPTPTLSLGFRTC